VVETIALIGCCQRKLARPAPARELYTSPLFRLSVAWAEARGLPWLVLSARHGVVAPQQVVEPYDLSLSQVAKLADDLKRWRLLCHVTLRGRARRFVLLAGKLYREAVIAPGGELAHDTPLAGLGIGQRLAWLTGDAGRAYALPAEPQWCTFGRWND
jgi:hypothetical protein